jgi:hypothetical protein
MGRASALPARQSRQVQELVPNAVRQAHRKLQPPTSRASKQYRSLPVRRSAQDDEIRHPHLGTAPHAHPPLPLARAAPGRVEGRSSRLSENRTVNRAEVECGDALVNAALQVHGSLGRGVGIRHTRYGALELH